MFKFCGFYWSVCFAGESAENAEAGTIFAEYSTLFNDNMKNIKWFFDGVYHPYSGMGSSGMSRELDDSSF